MSVLRRTAIVFVDWQGIGKAENIFERSKMKILLAISLLMIGMSLSVAKTSQPGGQQAPCPECKHLDSTNL